MSWSAGMMLGPLAAGYLYHVSPGVAYLAAGAAAVLAGLALPWRRARPALEGVPETLSAPEAPSDASQPAPTEQETGLVTSAKGRTPWLLYGAWLANFGSYFSAASVRNFFAHLGAVQGVSVPSQGLLLFSMGVFQSLTFFALSREHRWTRHPLALPVFMVVAGAAVVAIVPALPLALRIIPFAVAGIGFGGTYSLSLYRSVQSANPAAAVGIHEGIIGAGVVCGALVGGLAGRHIGLDAPFILGGCVSGVLLIPLILLLRKPGNRR
jgi:predicted MFS family arabinose efflux permease